MQDRFVVVEIPTTQAHFLKETSEIHSLKPCACSLHQPVPQQQQFAIQQSKRENAVIKSTSQTQPQNHPDEAVISPWSTHGLRMRRKH